MSRLKDKGHPTLDEARAEFVRRYLIETLDLARWNISEAARLSGRTRPDFYKLCAKHGVKWENKNNSGSAAWRELRS